MLPIAALVGSIFGNPVLAADEAATETTPVKAEIKEVRVKDQLNAPATVERVNLDRIQQEMIRDNKDLVRYSTDVGLSDSGRHQKGFAVRGVEGNRVGVSIDGVSCLIRKKTHCMHVMATSTARACLSTPNSCATSKSRRALTLSIPVAAHWVAA